MSSLFWWALALQGGLMMVDEFVFHWRRGLPVWERRGHPIDTFFFLLPLSVLAFFSPGPVWRPVFCGLGVLSCLIITKDEAVHLRRASAMEQWLHSLLFVLHPVVLIAGYFVWVESSAPFVWVWSAVLAFGFYQILFWNYYADRIFKARL